MKRINIFFIKQKRVSSALLFLFVVQGYLYGQNCGNTTEIGGYTFEDIYTDGIIDGVDKPLPSVSVEVFDETGSVGTATSDLVGNFLFTGLTAGKRYRVEFTTPVGMEESESNVDSRTTVQFATAGNCAINCGFFFPGCTSIGLLPDFVTTCFVSGDPLGGGTAANLDAIIAAPYTATGINPAVINKLATFEQVGAVWAIAFQPSTQTIFTSALLKRHSGLGPLGLGGIYAIDYNNPAAPAVTNWLDVNTIANVGTDPRNINALPASASEGSQDPDAFAPIGKIGIGDIDISQDETTLYVMSLNNNGELLEIDIDSKTLNASYPIPNPGCGAASDVRPFAVKVYKEKIYVGLVCSGQVAGQNDIQFFVMELSGGAFTTVLNSTLNYPKGAVHDAYQLPNPPDVCIGWESWVDNYNQLYDAGSSAAGPRKCRPQAILSDIEIDADGSMILGFMDRTGHQTGYLQFGTNDFTQANGYTGGDMLKAYNNNGTFVIENGGTTVGGGGCGANGQGPGGGEFFCDETFFGVLAAGLAPVEIHQETSHGGLAILPGTNNILVSVMDPFNVFSAGIKWMDKDTGRETQAFEVYGAGAEGTFGKSAGLGDIEFLGDPIPIEIGNYVWWDTDLNGLMDSDEFPIPNMPVELWLDPDGNTQGNNPLNGDETLLATTTTDANGRYIFSQDGNVNSLTAEDWSYTLADKVEIGTFYQVRIPDYSGNAGASPSGNSANAVLDAFAVVQGFGSGATILLSPTQVQGNLNDSNGYDNPDNAAAAVVTGTPGENDHNFDFAFMACPLQQCIRESGQFIIQKRIP